MSYHSWWAFSFPDAPQEVLYSVRNLPAHRVVILFFLGGPHILQHPFSFLLASSSWRTFFHFAHSKNVRILSRQPRTGGRYAWGGVHTKTTATEDLSMTLDR